MDDSDRTESRESPVAIPDHLVFAIEEWLEERIRQGCDGYDGEAARRAVVEAVHLYDAFVTKSLTASQVAELADGAAEWLGPRWPTNQREAEEVARLLTATRELLGSPRPRGGRLGPVPVAYGARRRRPCAPSR